MRSFGSQIESTSSLSLSLSRLTRASFSRSWPAERAAGSARAGRRPLPPAATQKAPRTFEETGGRVALRSGACVLVRARAHRSPSGRKVRGALERARRRRLVLLLLLLLPLLRLSLLLGRAGADILRRHLGRSEIIGRDCNGGPASHFRRTKSAAPTLGVPSWLWGGREAAQTRALSLSLARSPATLG